MNNDLVYSSSSINSYQSNSYGRAKYWIYTCCTVSIILIPMFLFTVKPGYLKPITIHSQNISKELDQVLEKEYGFNQPDSINCPTVTIWSKKKFYCNFTVDKMKYKVQIFAYNKTGNIIINEPYSSSL